MGKSFRVKVLCLTCGELEFAVQSSATGLQLFNKTCNTLNIRETWYFGLMYEDERGDIAWLKDKPKVLKQNIPKNDVLELMFRVKYYPEDCALELIEEVTQHQFYTHIKHNILMGRIYCPAETAVLLASYSMQSQFGDYDSNVHVPGFLKNEQYLPASVLEKYQISDTMWESRMIVWYSEHKGKTEEEAEMEYIRIAQDLEQYGVTFFHIQNKNGTVAYLGVDALGLHVYEESNLLSPRVAFLWGEIKTISFHGTKFTVRLLEKKKAQFYTDTRITKRILSLCIGNHRRWINRRMPESVEEQQLKRQASVRKEHRQQERLRNEENERIARQQEEEIRRREEKEKEDLLKKLAEAKEEAKRAEQDAKLAMERAQAAEMLAHASTTEVEGLLSKLDEVVSMVSEKETEKERITKDYEKKLEEQELASKLAIENAAKKKEMENKLGSEAGIDIYEAADNSDNNNNNNNSHTAEDLPPNQDQDKNRNASGSPPQLTTPHTSETTEEAPETETLAAITSPAPSLPLEHKGEGTTTSITATSPTSATSQVNNGNNTDTTKNSSLSPKEKEIENINTTTTTTTKTTTTTTATTATATTTISSTTTTTTATVPAIATSQASAKATMKRPVSILKKSKSSSSSVDGTSPSPSTATATISERVTIVVDDSTSNSTNEKLLDDVDGETANFTGNEEEARKFNEEDHARIDSKQEYTERNRSSLLKFRSELSAYQDKSKLTQNDRVDDANKKKNMTKLRTLQQIKKGSTRERIAFFEQM